MDHDLCRFAARVAGLIGRQAYDNVVSLCASSRLSASDLREIVREYGRTPCDPPPSFCDELDAVRILGAPDEAWSVRFPVWTAEEGRSDLTVEMTLSVCGERVIADLDDLGVL